jgi:8-oxo-dGTP diphosphatase
MGLVKYVAGFAYYERRVLLVNKKAPKWQEGLWNGVGGKCEPDETPSDAMRREFYEETGHDIENWTLFCNECGPGYVVHFYSTVIEGNLAWPHYNDVGEPLSWAYFNDVPRIPCIGNVYWLVPLGYDWRGRNVYNFVTDNDIREKATW